MKLTPLPLTHHDPARLTAADGHGLTCIGTINLTLTLKGLKISQKFSIVKDLNFKMILGLDMLQRTHACIDFGHNTLSLCDDLVIEPLLGNQPPSNVIRVTQNCTIPPRSEAVIATLSDKPYNGQFLLTPLPTVYQKNISLAHSVVSINNRKTQCRILNPTDAPVSLHKRTTLATVTPVSDKQIFTYEKSQTVPEKPTVDLDAQFNALKDLGIEVDATDYTHHQKQQLVNFLYSNRDLFTSDVCSLPGTNLVTHTIDTGDAQPIRQRPYRHSPEAKKEIDRQISKLLDSGIIEESDSAWSSPVVLVKKKSGDYRLCVDMRKVNAVTKPIFFPLPLLEDVFQKIAENNASVFSVCDFTSGFFQIFLDDASKPKTAFTTHRGNYQYRRLPFGLQGAPASFQILMARTLGNILFSYALCYVDDVLLFSRSPEQHIEHLSEVFDRFRQANLRLNPSKCKFALRQVTYLGHVLSKDGVACDPSKIEVIKSFPVPKNAQQLRSYFGIVNYYRKFIQSFSIKTANLRSLLKRDAKFVWNSVHQQEFDFCKQALTSAPVLGLPNMQKPFILTTDASCSGIGYILSQLDDNGHEHPICFGGRGLKRAEVNYTVSELECLAIIEGTKCYHPYLISQPFTIVTDHVSLTYLNTLKAGKSRLQRWSLHLQSYTFTIKHKAGKLLTHADGLSRREYPPPPDEDDDTLDDSAYLTTIDTNPFDCTVNTKHPDRSRRQLHEINFVYDRPIPSNTDSPDATGNTSDIAPVTAMSNDTEISAAQRTCPDFQEIIEYIESGKLPDSDVAARKIIFDNEQYTIIDDTLYHLYTPRHKNKDKVHPVVQQLCLPRTKRDEVTKAYHDQNSHIGFDKLYESLRSKYYWPRMYADLSEYVRSCTECQQTKRPTHSKKAPLKSLPVEDVFARFHLDYLGPLPVSNGFRYILVAIDSTSLYPEIHPTKTCDADETAKVLYEQIFCRYGCPLSILTDRGSCFRSSLINALCKIFKVKQIFTSSFHPQTNSRAEHFNSVILKSLRIYCTKESDWSNLLPAIAMSHRASTTTSHGFSPFEVLFGTKMRTPIDTSIINDVRTSPNIDIYLQHMLPKIELTREIAKQNIRDCNKITQFYYDRHAAFPRYSIGQKVLLYDSTTPKGVCKKLKRRWLGPYIIVDKGNGYTYRLRRCSDGHLLKSHTHSNRLKPFYDSRDKFHARNPPSTAPNTSTDQPPITRDNNTTTDTTDLGDGWFEIDRITSRRIIAGKPHFRILWKDGTTSYEPDENVSDYAKTQYYTRCQARRRKNTSRTQ